MGKDTAPEQKQTMGKREILHQSRRTDHAHDVDSTFLTVICSKSIILSRQPFAERTIGATNGCITAIAMMKKPLRIGRGLPNTKRLVSITSDHTLRSRVIG